MAGKDCAIGLKTSDIFAFGFCIQPFMTSSTQRRHIDHDLTP
jgi:hypothetical protein